MNSVQVTAFHPDKATYRPGEPVEFLITLTDTLAQPANVEVMASIRYLTEEIAHLAQPADIPAGGQATFRLPWTPPSDAPKGYGADLTVRSSAGQTLAQAHTAFDVLTSWTQAPRYGFLTDFTPERTDFEGTMAWLTLYHINGLQFYDWMYRHEDLLAPQDPYRDPLGRLLSRHTVDALIDAVHRLNIAAMPYTAIYGASVSFYKEHPDWALRKANGDPFPFGDDFLYIMDPSPGSPWTRHLISEFARVMRETKFDGIHLDQYGDPKSGFDTQGNPIDLAHVIPDFIDLTKATVIGIRPDAAVVFNAVNNWPIETVAAAAQDFVYIEVWPPNTLYRDLWELIVNAQKLGKGKPVVLAAYIDPVRARNARLADAVIFASGGYHIELGEPDGMLADAYFPRYKPMGDELAAVIRRYYDFAVRYENVLAIGTRDVTQENGDRIAIEGVSTDPDRVYNKVWVISRRGEDFETINLINLIDIPDPEWNGLLLADPTPLDELRVQYRTEQKVERVWLASPDFANPQAMLLDFEPGQDTRGNYVEFTIPRLEYWGLVVVEFAN
jgi:dextranase